MNYHQRSFQAHNSPLISHSESAQISSRPKENGINAGFSQTSSLALDRTNSKTVIVVGGGAGGCCTALKLAEAGYKVILLEKNKLFSGSSSRTPGRMGLGFHYVDSQTAIMYLKATINFVRAFPGFRIGEELPLDHSYRHGRYFITPDSLFSAEEILKTYQKIQSAYAQLIKEDPRNEVFGPAETIYRILSPEEYSEDVNMSKVAVGIETAEHLLDWPKFSNYLRAKILAEKNITVYEDTAVINVIQHPAMTPRYHILTAASNDHSSSIKSFSASYVINSTWEHLDKLNQLAGFSMPEQVRTNRVKILCEVELPPALINSPSMFFCMGPHCMFSNMGNGRGMMTYAQKTNLEYSTDLEVSENAIRLLAGQASPEEKTELSQQIIAGVAQYIPQMQDAKMLDVKFGVVKTIGEVDIFNCESKFHCRDYHGIRVEAEGWISNPCMKLLYCLENANIITNLIEESQNNLCHIN